MNPLISKLAKKSLPLLIAALAGYCGATIPLGKRIDKLVAEAYEKEALRFRADFKITCNDNNEPAKISEIFSKKEIFKSGNESESFLESKVGFKYEVDDTICRRTGEETVSGLPYTECIGTEYTFEVDKTFDKVEENLSILNYTQDGGPLPSSSVSLNDSNHDGVPDYIRVSDKMNNTKITIRRDRDGKLLYENINDEGARQLFELYTLRYNTFKIEHHIDEAIMNYSPKLEVIELKPEKQE